MVSAIRVLPMYLLNGILFFLTVLLLTIGFYLGWINGDSVTLRVRPSFCRTCCLLLWSSAPICSLMLQIPLVEESALLATATYVVDARGLIPLPHSRYTLPYLS